MATVTLGNNDFFGVPFPVVVADRFLHIYTGDDGSMRIDVFRWDADRADASYEVEGSRPMQDNITTNPTGIVTFSNAPDGGFLFKFRPKPGVSQIFGRVPVTDEITVKISDFEIVVARDETPMATITRNMISGMPIGIQVGVDGSIGIGVSALPAGMKLARRTAT